MPGKNLDVIMAAHDTATERRKQGKPSWAAEIKIKHLLSETSDDTIAAATGRNIAAALRDGLPAGDLDIDSPEYDNEIDYIIDDLEDVRPYEDMDGTATLNAILDELYDWADIKRVWLG
jgi:hypothetical protein